MTKVEESAALLDMLREVLEAVDEPKAYRAAIIDGFELKLRALAATAPVPAAQDERLREFAEATFEHEEAHKTSDVSRIRKANTRRLNARAEAKDALATPSPTGATVPACTWPACMCIRKGANPCPNPSVPTGATVPGVLTEDEKELRRMLCAHYSGAMAYMDDGEAQDNREHPMIDFMRDSLADIKRKMFVRSCNAAHAAGLAPPSAHREQA